MYTMDICVRQGSVLSLDPHTERNAFLSRSDLLSREHIENLRFPDFGGELPYHGQHVPHRHTRGKDAGKISEYRGKAGNRPGLYRTGGGKRRLAPDIPVKGRRGDFQGRQELPPDGAHPAAYIAVLPDVR